MIFIFLPSWGCGSLPAAKLATFPPWHRLRCVVIQLRGLRGHFICAITHFWERMSPRGLRCGSGARSRALPCLLTPQLSLTRAGTGWQSGVVNQRPQTKCCCRLLFYLFHLIIQILIFFVLKFHWDFSEFSPLLSKTISFHLAYLHNEELSCCHIGILCWMYNSLHPPQGSCSACT